MIQPEELQALADALVQGGGEVDHRAAVSRAYYAAFHKARRLLRGLGFRVPHGDQAHAYLWLRLLNCGDAQTELAGSNLNALRRDRNFADYDVDLSLTQATAARQVGTARLIIQQLDAAALEPTRTNITDAMKLYENNVLKQVTWTP